MRNDSSVACPAQVSIGGRPLLYKVGLADMVVPCECGRSYICSRCSIGCCIRVRFLISVAHADGDSVRDRTA